MTAAQAQFRARGLALTLLQAEARALSATEAARLADSAAARYRRLYATRDVLRSTANSAASFNFLPRLSSRPPMACQPPTKRRWSAACA